MKRVYIVATQLGFDHVVFQIDEWCNGRPFTVKLKYLPYFVTSMLHPGFACYVDINEDAVESKHLKFDVWSPQHQRK